MASLPSLKLTYFNKKARGEPIGLALEINGIPFEDERLTSREQWVALKPTVPFGQLPVLTLDNSIIIAHSAAILRYVGKFGPLKLYPDDSMKAALVDQIISQVHDVELAFRPSNSERDPTRKLSMRAELVESGLPPLFTALDRFIGSIGGNYAAGSDITIADFCIYQMKTSYGTVTTDGSAYDGIPFTILDTYPNIQRVVTAVKNHPAVVKWEATH
ncbi:hypothetical protein HDU79_007024 [Rhizoclosmatium sp. JEL0117]|nr:hypothetical protein HDU79_007024 [Rhizoclosmatium sp. JEL0117]